MYPDVVRDILSQIPVSKLLKLIISYTFDGLFITEITNSDIIFPINERAPAVLLTRENRAPTIGLEYAGTTS